MKSVFNLKYRKNLFFFISLLSFSYISWKFNKIIQDNLYQYKYLDFPYVSYTLDFLRFIINSLFGCLLGLDIFIQEFEKEGKWKLNFEKAIIIVLPFLFFLIIQHFIVTPRFVFVKLFLIENSSFYQVIVGYMGVTCFYKEILSKTIDV